MGLLPIACLILGIYMLTQRGKVIGLDPGAFPHVRAEKFAEWQRLELRGIDIFAWAAFGTFVPDVGIIALSYAGGYSPWMDWSQMLLWIALISGIAFSYKAATRARKVKAKLKIVVK